MTALEVARARMDAGDPDAAYSALRPALAFTSPDDPTLVLASRALRALGRDSEAADLLKVLSQRQPGNGIHAHNLAAASGDAGDHRTAASAARRAIELRDAPESWLVLGRALQAAGDLSNARDAFAQAVTRRPAYLDALKALAQLDWMRTGDATLALQPLLAALRQTPSPEMAAMVCGIIRDVGDPATAYDFIRPWCGRGSIAVELAANAAAASFNLALQIAHARSAIVLAPGLPEARHALAKALLAGGRIDEASRLLEAWSTASPDDQVALALQQTARRLAGDPQALRAEDYAALVRVHDVETPAPWPNREPWLHDLATALRSLHSFQAEPFGQSLRAGAQSRTDPRWAGDPVIDATLAAFTGPLEDYARTVMSESVRMPILRGAWSVRLTGEGRHIDHVHPVGRISSAFYVALPDRLRSDGRQGWIRFGGTRLGPDVEVAPEYWVEPKPGRLVLFPSWLWHGTEPFDSPGERLTLAFDAVLAETPSL